MLFTATRLARCAEDNRTEFLTRDIDNSKSVCLSVCPSVCPSVRNVPLSDENDLTYRHSLVFFHHTVAQSF